MENIAYYFGSATIYRSGIIMSLAIVAAVAIAVILWCYAGGKFSAIIPVVTIGLVSSFFFSRLIYWYCCFEQYNGFFDAMFDIGHGGFSLFGAMAGVIIAVFISRLLGLVKDLPALLDCFAPAGALGICIGRLSAFFTADDKGKTMSDSLSAQKGFPFAVSVTNEATGTVEYRFPTFFYEALAAFAIFVFVIMLFSSVYFKGTRKKGTVALMFFSLFGATQTVLESTRYDSLFLHSNGFLSLMQIASAVMLVVPVVVFSVQGLKSKSKGSNPIFLWVISALFIGSAGYLEYYVQRHGSAGAVIYPIMIACLVTVSMFTFLYASKLTSKSDYYEQPSWDEEEF